MILKIWNPAVCSVALCMVLEKMYNRTLKKLKICSYSLLYCNGVIWGYQGKSLLFVVFCSEYSVFPHSSSTARSWGFLAGKRANKPVSGMIPVHFIMVWAPACACFINLGKAYIPSEPGTSLKNNKGFLQNVDVWVTCSQKSSSCRLDVGS